MGGMGSPRRIAFAFSLAVHGGFLVAALSLNPMASETPPLPAPFAVELVMAPAPAPASSSTQPAAPKAEAAPARMPAPAAPPKPASRAPRPAEPPPRAEASPVEPAAAAAEVETAAATARSVESEGLAASTAAGTAPASADAPAGDPQLITDPRFRQPPAPPVYPRRARDTNQQGTVMVRALIGPDGRTREVRVWESSGFHLLDAAAAEAVRGWHFEPAQWNGRGVDAWVQVPVRFVLRG